MSANMVTSPIFSGAGEMMYLGSSLLDEQRRHALTWIGGEGPDGAQGLWEFIPDPGGQSYYRIRHAAQQEYLYVGSNLLPCGSRRIALSWVGGGSHPSSEGAAGVWEVLSAGPNRPLGSFRLKNVGTGEYLYIGSTTLPCDSRRLVLTWVGGGEVDGDNGVWTIPNLAPGAWRADATPAPAPMMDAAAAREDRTRQMGAASGAI